MRDSLQSIMSTIRFGLRGPSLDGHGPSNGADSPPIVPPRRQRNANGSGTRPMASLSGPAPPQSPNPKCPYNGDNRRLTNLDGGPQSPPARASTGSWWAVATVMESVTLDGERFQ